jgi:hypothetical protein
MSQIHNRLSRQLSTIGCLSGQDQPLLSIDVIMRCTLGVRSMTELRIISNEVSTVSLSVVETLKSRD